MQKSAGAEKNKKPMAFSHLMREEFLRRCRQNPSYSLRSFARQLGVDASLLSKVLRGQRAPSTALIKSVGPNIGLRPKQLSALLKGKEDVIYNKINDDVFALMRDWFHFAILELTKTVSFVSDVTWIADRLSIHKAEAASALERLERLGFLEKKNGSYTLLAPNNNWEDNAMTSAARKDLQKQLTAKALQAIENTPFELRESSSLTLACTKDLLPEIKKKIQSFKTNIDEYVATNTSPDEVYQLVISLYPLTKTKNTIGENL